MLINANKLSRTLLFITIQTYAMDCVPEKIALDCTPITLKREDNVDFRAVSQLTNDRKPLLIPSKPSNIEDLPKLSMQKNNKKAVDKRIVKVKYYDDLHYVLHSFKSKSSTKARYPCNQCNKPFNSYAALNKHANFCSEKDKGKIPLINSVINKDTIAERMENLLLATAFLAREKQQIIIQSPIAQSLPLKELLQS